VDSGSGPSSEIAVHDYSWGAMSGGGVARGSVQNVQLTLDPSSIEPGLWGNMLENRNFQAVVHVRDGSGHEYLTYTFSTATLLSFQTTESDGAAPVDRITLSFDHVAEDYSDNHAQFDVSQSTVGAGGNLSAPPLQLSVTSNPFSVRGPLTVNAPFRSGASNVITLDTTTITINGQPTAYDPCLLTEIIVSLGASDARVNVLGTAANVPVTINGGGGNNTLQGPNSANTWHITGPNSGTLNGTVTFVSVQNLVGGSAGDAFYFQTGGSMTGTIDGAGGT